MNGRNVLFERAAISGWPQWIVMALTCLALLRGAAQADIAERQEGVGQNLGAADVSQLPRTRAVAQPRQQKPYKLLPRPRDQQPGVQKNMSLRSPRRDAGSSSYREASGSSPASTTSTFAPAASFTPAAVDSPAASASFSALLDDSSYYNPDTAGAVGPNHLMSIAGSYMRIQDRFGNTNSTTLLTTFWQGTAGLTNLHLFDPRIIYDPQGGRWIHVLENFETNNSGLLVAVSRTSDPTGLWNRYFISLNGTARVLMDSPNLGLTKDWIVVTANMYEQTNFTHFSQDIFVFTKTNLFTNGPAQFTRFVYTNDITEENIMAPAVTYDDASRASSTNFLVGNYVANTSQGIGFLALYYLYKTGNTINFDLIRSDVTDYLAFGTPGWASNSTVDFFLPQSGTTNKIDAGDCRIQNVVFRADPNRGFTIWCVQTIFLPDDPPTHSAIQWWELTTAGNVVQNGLLEDPTGVRSFAYPSMAVNSRNDVLIGYSRFAANQFPSANYAFHNNSDPNSSIRNGVLLKPGDDFYKAPDGSGNNFWGDASATVIDPVNDSDMWTLQQYAAIPLMSTNRWGTWWGRVSPPVNLSIGMTDSPNPVAAGANLTYSITVTNTELKPVGGVRVIDTLPAGSTFISANPSQGACLVTNGTVTCDFGSLDETGRVSVAIIVRLVNTGTINNSATVSAFGVEGTPSDNTDTVSTTVSPAADLGLSMTGGPDPVTVSNTLTYTLVVTNRGPSAATSVMISNTLPANVTYITSSSSQGSCSRSGSLVTCSLGTLATNNSATVSVLVAPNISGLHTNRATVSTTAIDGSLSDNSAQAAVRANASPTMGAISDRTIAEDGVLAPVAFTVADVETSAGSLGLAGFSSNPALVPNGNITFGGSGASRTITVMPATNASGTTMITRIVTDGDGATATNTFLLTVTPVNDAPVITDIANLAIDEDTVAGPLVLTIGDAETPAAALSLSGGSSVTALVPNANIVFGGSGVNRTVTITPATNQFGTTTITITVSDGTNAVSDMFTLTVNGVNDLPTISDIADRSVNEDTATGAIPFTVGDVETASGSLTLSVTSSNPSLVPTNNVTFGGSGASRTINVQPATNQFGSVILAVTVMDANGGSATNTFMLTVNPVNDLPTLDAISDVTTNEDAGNVVVNLAGISTGAANEVQTLSVSATTSNPGLLLNLAANYSAGTPTVGTVTFTPAPNSNGTATITVTVNDNGASNNITTRIFTVNITAVNDAPVVSAIGNRTINEDSSTNVSVTVGDVETPATGLTVTASSSDQLLVPNANLSVSGSGSNRTVTITPAGNMSGACTILVVVSDGALSGTNSFLLTVLPVNDAPTISSVADRAINEDSATNVSFTIGDLETAAGSLTLLPSSSNPALVPNGNLVLGGAGANRTLTITPARDQFGVTLISVVVSDPEGASATNSFTLTVLSVNDAPTLDAISDVSILEDSLQQIVNLTGIGSGAANENQVLSVSATSSNPGLIPTPQITYTSGATGMLRFTPNANSNGTAIITVTVNDGGAPNPTFSRQFTVTVTPVNDDPTITAFTNITLNEDVATNLSFTIGDVETPVGSLTLTADSSNPELIISAEITFGGSGANRTVTLRPLTNAFGSATITITVADANGGQATSDFELTVSPVNDAPTITGLANVSIAEDGVAGPLAFTISDADNSSSALTVSLLSSNQTLLPTNRITLGGSGASRNLTARPSTNQFGTTLITVIVSDGSLFASNSFLLTVTSVNDLPTITGPGNVAINEDGSTGPLAVTIGDVETPAGSLSATGFSSDTLLVPNANIIFGGSGGNRTVTVTPAPDRFGSATIQLVIADLDGGSATNNFLVTVNAVNDPPTIAPISNLTTNEDSGPVTVSLTGIGAGGIGEAQVLSVTVASSNPALIPTNLLMVAYNSAASTGTLTFTPATNASGTATITVTVMDDAPTNNTTIRTFDITVTPVNDAPTLDPIPSLTIAEDSLQQTVNLTGVSTGATNETQTLTVTATSSNPGLTPNPQITYISPNSTGTLRFTPIANSNGTAIITVTVNDGGAQNSNIVQTFTVTVTNVNDAPTLSALTDRITGKNVPVVVPVTVDDIDNSPAGLTLSGASSNTNLVNAASFAFGGVGNSRTATILPRTNAVGSALITISVSDGVGGVASNSFLLTVTNLLAPPVISGPVDTTIGEDNIVTLNFSVSDPEGSASNVVVTSVGTNPSLLGVGSLQPGGSGSSRTLRIAPNTNQSGSATITLTANSFSGLSASSSFVLTVTNVNDVPSISGIPNLSIDEDTVTGPLSFTVGDVETAAGSLVVSATSSNLVLLPNANVTLGGAGADRAVTLTPVAAASGSSLVTLWVSDANGSSNSTSFLLTVNPVNDVPTLNALTNVTLAINAPLQTVGLSGISAGAGETANLIVSANSSNPSLIAGPTVSYTNTLSTGVLNYTPLAEASGTSIITVTVNDSGPSNNIVTRSFVVTVNPGAVSNAPPTISSVSSQTTSEDVPLNLSVTVADTDTPLLNLSVTGTSTNTALVGNSNICVSGSGALRTVKIAPSTNQSGTTLITLRVSDGLATNSISFLLTVTAVNDPPTLNPIPDLSLVAAFANYTHPFNGISLGASNETTGTLTVTVTSSDLNVASVSASSYTSPNTNGTVTIAKINNSATGKSVFSVVVSDGSLSTTQTFNVFVRASANANPTITSIANQTINAGVSTAAIPFTVGDSQTPVALLAVAGKSSNPSLVPSNNIVFGGSGASRTVTVTPAAGQFGTAQIYLTVTDTNFGMVTTNFLLAVNQANVPPTISTISPQVISEDTVLGPLSFLVNDLDSAAASLTVTASSGNTTLIPNANLTLGGGGTNRAILIRPATNQTGSATITLTVSDGAASTNTTFTVTVNNLNDPPTISAIADQVLNEDTVSSALAFTLADLETPAGSLAITALSSNPALLPTNNVSFGGSGANRTVTLIPAPDQFGAASVTITVNDGAATAMTTFLLTVNPVNDPPTLDAINNLLLSQDAGPQTVNLLGIGFGPVNEAQALFIAASSSNPGLLPHPKVNYTSPSATGFLTLTPNPGVAGTATVTVRVNDAGAVSNIFTRTFTVTVNAAPTISSPTNIVLTEDTVSSALSFTVGDTETAAAALSVAATSSDPTLIAPGGLVLGGSGASRTVTVSPLPNQSGFSVVTLFVSDGSGNTASNSFLVTVTSVNDAPTLAVISDLSLVLNAGLQTVNLSGIGSGAPNENQALMVMATSSNPSLIPHPNVNYSSPSALGSITFTPASGATGSVVITVKVMDDGDTDRGASNSVMRTFTVTVASEPPVLTIVQASGNVIVSWPAGAGSNWKLLCTVSVGGPWSLVPNTPVLASNRYSVTLPASGDAKLFRLCDTCTPPGLPLPPALNVTRQGANLVLRWSVAGGSFVLEETHDIVNPDWMPVSTQPSVAGSVATVTLPDSGATPRFFRLR